MLISKIKPGLIILSGLILFLGARASVMAAVTVESFGAKLQGTQSVLTWKTKTEQNNKGFNVYRDTAQNGTFKTKVNSAMIVSQCLINPTTCMTGAQYTFTDPTAPAGTVWYKLESVDGSNASQFFGPVSVTASATPTATKTPVPATSTSTPTTVPSNTPTRTQTYPPGVTPPTPLPTNTPTLTFTPSATPTRTQTYPPGVKPPTPAPTATAPRIAAVVPATVAPQPSRVGSNAASSSAQSATTTSDAVEPTQDNPDNSNDSSADQNSTATMLLRLGVVAISGMLGLGALVFGVLAIVLFVRMSRRGS